MTRSLSASTVKHYFQYRCERQLRYRMVPRVLLERAVGMLPPGESSMWSEAGNQFERTLVDGLAAKCPVLRPPEGARLSVEKTLAFLRGGGPESFIAQACIEVTAEDLEAQFGLSGAFREAVDLAPGYPDLIEVVTRDGVREGFRIIDIKATTEATLFHRTQVAYYALLLETLLSQNGIALPLLPVGEIWHLDSSGSAPFRRAPFRLAGYKTQVAEFLDRVVARVAQAEVVDGRDETRFHVYFKCEQCEFLPHCRRAVDPARGAAELDLSAVPGMTLDTKYVLRDAMEVRNVGDLAACALEFDSGPGDEAVSADVDFRSHPQANWFLRTRGDALVRRARAIAGQSVARLPDRYTHRMPDGFDVGIFLVVDHDPVEGRLAALGCLQTRVGRPDELVMAPVAQSGSTAERDALSRVLGAVVSTLSEVDAHNAAGNGPPLRAHLFVYEPSEAKDLAAALGRHLADETVRRGLLHMLRMFPPEDLLPEPEYRGASHLPATALRDIIEDLYALPCVVSHDLRNVTLALHAATPPLAYAYEPTERFARPFSARLSIDLCRALKTAALPASDVEADLTARLRAMASLAAWLVAQSGMAIRPFLRLSKRPFRWQSSFDPLNASDLDVLRAHELFQVRSDEIATLVALAAPWQARRDRQRCFARLRLLGVRGDERRLRMRFAVPAESRRAEFDVNARGLILTDDDPDRRLDPTAWRRHAVKLKAITRIGDQVIVDVETDSKPEGWNELLARTADDGWFIDQVRMDFNFPRMDAFLRYLAASEVIS